MIRTIVCALIAAALCAAIFLSSACFAAIKTTDCYRAIDKITPDGSLSEASWRYADTLSAFTQYNGTSTALTTTLKICWDDTAIYLAYQCLDSDIYSTITTRDGNAWEQDVVEVFATAPPGTKGYVEYESTPRGFIWDGKYTDIFQPSNAASWNSPAFATGTAIDGTVNNKTDQDGGFTVEMSLPWADVYGDSTIPVNGTKLRMNFYRINSNTPSVLGQPGSDFSYLSWSPVDVINFHQPSKFGEVTFLTQPVPEPSSLLALAMGGVALVGLGKARRR